MTDIHKGTRCLHGRYGRGRVEEIERRPSHAMVQFDGDACRRRVLLWDLVPEPRHMPPTSAPPLPPIRPRLAVVVGP